MAPTLDPIAKLFPQRQAWRLKVRVLRLWSVPNFLELGKIFSMEMILIDEFGSRIHATVKKCLIARFQKLMQEGCVYRISYVVVVDNSGPFRATNHNFRLFFSDRTVVQPCMSEKIPLLGICLTPFDKLHETFAEDGCLVDVIGMVDCLKGGNACRKRSYKVERVVFDMWSHIGKIECALFGDCGLKLKSYFVSANVEPAVVVLQFVKVKFFRGVVSLQNARNCSRALVNPDTPEAAKFRTEFVDHVLCSAHSPIGVSSDSSYEATIREELKIDYPYATVEELGKLTKRGCYAVVATIKEIMKHCSWWFPACEFSHPLIVDGGYFFCSECNLHVYDVSSRFRVKVKVRDFSGEAFLMLCDSVVQRLVDKTCHAILFENSQHLSGREFPKFLNALLGLKVCFVVEKKTDLTSEDGFHEVTSLYLGHGCRSKKLGVDTNSTPEQYIFNPPLTSVPPTFNPGSSSSLLLAEKPVPKTQMIQSSSTDLSLLPECCCDMAKCKKKLVLL